MVRIHSPRPIFSITCVKSESGDSAMYAQMYTWSENRDFGGLQTVGFADRSCWVKVSLYHRRLPLRRSYASSFRCEIFESSSRVERPVRLCSGSQATSPIYFALCGLGVVQTLSQSDKVVSNRDAQLFSILPCIEFIICQRPVINSDTFPRSRTPFGSVSLPGKLTTVID